MYLSQLWHFLICISPLILQRRYGFVKPTLMNNLAFISTIGIYLYLFVGPIAILTTVNLNSQLCHLPGDLVYEQFGYHYYIAYNVPNFCISFIYRTLIYQLFKVSKTIIK